MHLSFSFSFPDPGSQFRNTGVHLCNLGSHTDESTVLIKKCYWKVQCYVSKKSFWEVWSRFWRSVRCWLSHFYCCLLNIVADPWFLSRILIFFPIRISDPGSNNNKKEEGEKIFRCLTFFVAINFTKLKIIYFESLREKFEPVDKEKYFLPKQLLLSSQNMGWGSWLWDPGSGKKLTLISDPDPQQCFLIYVS